MICTLARYKTILCCNCLIDISYSKTERNISEQLYSCMSDSHECGSAEVAQRSSSDLTPFQTQKNLFLIIANVHFGKIRRQPYFTAVP